MDNNMKKNETTTTMMMTTTTTTTTTVAYYTTRDLILYSLGIGCGGHDHYRPESNNENDNNNVKNDENEKRFVYEHSNNFESFPIFPLALSFHAMPVLTNVSDDKHTTNPDSQPNGDYFDIRAFPPPSMQGGILPPQFIRQPQQANEEVEISSYPAIHISQSLKIHHPFPKPQQQQKEKRLMKIYINTKIISVVPKSIGTFVTTQTEFFHTLYQSSSSPLVKLCTAQATTLLLGIPSSLVVPFTLQQNETKKEGQQQQKEKNKSANQSMFLSSVPNDVIRYNIPNHQPYLYRLSGDYNPIHVDVSSLPSFLTSMLEEEEEEEKEMDGDGKDYLEKATKVRPILHGLCTLGYAVRASLSYLTKQAKQQHHETEQQQQQQQKQLKHETDQQQQHKVEITYVNCAFVKPLPVGDSIRVLLWKDKQRGGGQEEMNEKDKYYNDRRMGQEKIKLRFRVVNDRNDQIVVDGGIVDATVTTTSKLASSSKVGARSKL